MTADITEGPVHGGPLTENWSTESKKNCAPNTPETSILGGYTHEPCGSGMFVLDSVDVRPNRSDRVDIYHCATCGARVERYRSDADA